MNFVSVTLWLSGFCSCDKLYDAQVFIFERECGLQNTRAYQFNLHINYFDMEPYIREVIVRLFQ